MAIVQYPNQIRDDRKRANGNYPDTLLTRNIYLPNGTPLPIWMLETDIAVDQKITYAQVLPSNPGDITAGIVYEVGGVLYRRGVDSSNNPAWIAINPPASQQLEALQATVTKLESEVERLSALELDLANRIANLEPDDTLVFHDAIQGHTFNTAIQSANSNNDIEQVVSLAHDNSIIDMVQARAAMTPALTTKIRIQFTLSLSLGQWGVRDNDGNYIGLITADFVRSSAPNTAIGDSLWVSSWDTVTEAAADFYAASGTAGVNHIEDGVRQETVVNMERTLPNNLADGEKLQIRYHINFINGNAAARINISNPTVTVGGTV